MTGFETRRHLVEAMLKTVMPIYLALRTDLDAAAELIEKAPGELATDDLVGLKGRTTRLSNLLEDYLYGLIELREARSETLQLDSAAASFRELVGDVQRTQQLVARMEDRIRDLRQSGLNYLQEATNRRLNILAVLSAIYLPSTLIADVYGMNFDRIPITGIPHGYVIVLLIMVGLVVGQLVFFYRRGWLR